MQRITSQGEGHERLAARPPSALDGDLSVRLYIFDHEGIYAVITVFAVGERARSFKAISPGLLSPLGIIFALFIAFTAAQVWTDNEKARGRQAR